MITAATLLDECTAQLDHADAQDLVPRFRRAIARYPLAPPLLYTIATTCLRYGYPALWHHYRSLALSLPHVTYEDLMYRGHAKLREGDWSGWADREARLYSPYEVEFGNPEWRSMQWTTRAWDGQEDIADKVLFAIADGGFGDCFQMLRYVPMLSALARTVILTVRPECLSLARHNYGHLATVVTRSREKLPPFDRHVWMMSLPALIGTLPPFTPLSAPTPIDRDRSRGRRVGICWAGASNQPTNDLEGDRDRSLSLSDLTDLVACEDLEVFSLQVGKFALDAQAYPRIKQPPQPLDSWADTANLIAGLDHVVTMDTAVAHLAGALGAPTFLLLQMKAEFRWGSGDGIEWYPSMQLIRQCRRGDWSGVVKQLLIRLDVHTARQVSD